jgi:hypothetical protein
MIDVAEHPATAKRRIALYLLGAGSGLAWTLLAIPAAGAVNRRGERLGWPARLGWSGRAGRAPERPGPQGA